MKIHDRTDWNPSYREGFSSERLPAVSLWAHHSATNAPPSTASLRADVEHMQYLEGIGQSRFSGGISYPWIIMPSARVFMGLSPGRQGAHTIDTKTKPGSTISHNKTGSAICFAGNYDIIVPSKAVLQAAAELIAEGFNKGWWNVKKFDGGHRDVFATSCPGKNIYSRLDDINKKAGQILNPLDDKKEHPLLKLGSRGDAVKDLQRGLIRQFRAHSYTIVNTGGADGVFGPGTETAVKRFQRHHNLEDDGVVGPKTWAKLNHHGVRVKVGK